MPMNHADTIDKLVSIPPYESGQFRPGERVPWALRLHGSVSIPPYRSGQFRPPRIATSWFRMMESLNPTMRIRAIPTRYGDCANPVRIILPDVSILPYRSRQFRLIWAIKNANKYFDEQTSQSLHADQGSSDVSRIPMVRGSVRRGSIPPYTSGQFRRSSRKRGVHSRRSRDVSIPPCESGQFRPDPTGPYHTWQYESQSLHTDQGSSDTRRATRTSTALSRGLNPRSGQFRR